MKTIQEENKAALRRFAEEYLNNRNEAVLYELMDHECVLHGAYMKDVGSDSYKRVTDYLFKIFPDFHYTIEEMVAEGDMVVVRAREGGTHAAEYLGIPPTGKHVEWMAISMVRFRNGKMVEVKATRNLLEFVKQAEGSITSGQAESNKNLARRFIEDHWNKFDMDVLDEICADDFIHHDNRDDRTREEQKQRIPMLRSAFPDMKMEIADIFAEGDRVTIRWTFQATNKGSFQKLPPSGKEVNLSCISIFRIEDNKIAEIWSNWDMLDFVQQLGFTLSPPSGERETAIRRELEEAWNKGNTDVLDDHIAPDFVRHGPPHPDVVGLDGLKKYIVGIPEADETFHITVDDMFSSADKTLTRFTIRAKPRGAKREATMTGTSVDLWNDGKSVERWVHVDYLGFMQRLGYELVPPGELK